MSTFLLWAGFPTQQTPDTVEIEEVVPGGLDVADWVTAAVVLGVAVVVAVLARRAVTRIFTARGAPVGVGRLVGRFAAAAAFLAGLVYALNSLDIRVGPILGALGMTRRPFAIGDQIASNDFEGTVEDVNTRAVVMKTFDGERVLIPSSMVLKNPIHNHTAFAQRRTSVAVGVAYEADLRRAREIILGALRDVEDVRTEPVPEALLEELADSSVNFAVRYWHEPTIAEFWRVRDRVIEVVFGALRAADIEIPFPQRTLHLAPGLVQEIELAARPPTIER